MATKKHKRDSMESQPELLKGWKQIADFLGQPITVAEYWAQSGLPVERQARFVVAKPDELNAWLNRESGEAVHVATDQTDLAGELKRSLRDVRKHGSRTQASKKNAA